MRRRIYRTVTWGDVKHWEIHLGRLRLSWWCSGAPCRLPGVRSQHRPSVTIRTWR